MNVYLNEFNVMMDRKVYLPLVSGMLTASALESPLVRSSYDFKPFIFHRDRPGRVLEEYDEPADVVGFSSSIWNSELNYTLASALKRTYPSSLIIFGGPSVPNDAAAFMEQHPYVDVAVHGEGENTFREILERFTVARTFGDVLGVTFRDPETGQVVKTPDRPTFMDLDVLPSPYLNGVMDRYVRRHPGYEYQATFESNRGCPFKCAFCYWGNGPGKKTRNFGINRLRGEVEWFAKHEIEYVFGADANFGMYERDIDVAGLFAEAKKTYGYPKKFRVCYGKNKGDRILEVVKFLDDHGLSKGGTLSRQSNDPETLNNILRQNIKLDVYDRLQMEYHKADIPVYTEFILGLPGETYESFVNGIEETLCSRMQGQIIVFICEVLPNTLMADPVYQEEHGIEVVRVELAEPHAARKLPGEVVEYEDIVIGTKSMPTEDMLRAYEQAWIVQWLHGLRLGFYCLSYLNDQFGVPYTGFTQYLSRRVRSSTGECPLLHKEFAFFEGYFQNLPGGGAQSVFLEDYGNIGWQIEEASFLRIARDLDRFHDEFSRLAKDYLADHQIDVDPDVLDEVLLYQRLRTQTYDDQAVVSHEFRYSVAEYFQNYANDIPSRIRPQPQVVTMTGQDFDGDREAFAKTAIWFGRRDFGFLRKADWELAEGVSRTP